MDQHLAPLHESVTWSRGVANDTLANLTQAMGRLGSDAPLAALKQMAGITRQQALVMAMADVFFALTVLFLALVLLAPIMRKPTHMAAGGGH
jgi:DHA2 family multidrug resistance protein